MLRDIIIWIRGRSPLLMHRYAGEEPSEPKPPKGKKTQEWIDAKRKSKWLKAAYWQHGMFCIPPENVEAMLAKGAMQIRKGQDFKYAVIVVDDFIPLWVYDGPDDKKGRNLKGKLEDYYIPEYIDVRGVVIQRNRVDACRPIFRDWGIKFTVRYDTDQNVTEQDIQTALGRAALCDFRPRFGRFRVADFQPLKELSND